MKRTLHLTRTGPWASTYGIMTSSPDKHDSGAGMSSPAAEDALLKAWKGGDAAALGDLLSCFQPRIWSLCYRTLGRYEDAADLAQESMVKVIQGLRGFDGRCDAADSTTDHQYFTLIIHRHHSELNLMF